jgi:hypothetical protein
MGTGEAAGSARGENVQRGHKKIDKNVVSHRSVSHP